MGTGGAGTSAHRGARKALQRDGDWCHGPTVAARVPLGPWWGTSPCRVPMGIGVPPLPRPSSGRAHKPSVAPSSLLLVIPARAVPRRADHTVTASPCHHVTASPRHRNTASPIPEALSRHGASQPPRRRVRPHPLRTGSRKGPPTPPHPTPAPGPPESLRGAGGDSGGGRGFDLFYSHRGKNERVKSRLHIRPSGERPVGLWCRSPAAAPGGIAGTSCVRSRRGAGRRDK